MDFDTTIVEIFELIACIIADIWLFLFTAYRNCDSQNGNVYTRKMRIASDDRDVRLRSTIPTRTKAFLGFKVAGLTSHGTFMLLQSFHKTTTLKTFLLARKRIA